MIENLNRLSFAPFGTLSPEPPDCHDWAQPWMDLNLTTGNAPTWQAVEDILLFCDAGMAVLSVSKDGVLYQDFYLDKSVTIRPGIFFSVSPFQEETAVCFCSHAVPKAMESRPPITALHISRTLQIEKLYTFFYQEKELGFLFPGEAHSPVELTYVDQGSLHSVADGQDILLEQGDLMFYGSNQWHMQYADVTVAPRFMTVAFDAGDYDFSDMLNRKFHASQTVVSLLQQMLQEKDKTDPLSGDMILNLLELLILNLKRKTNTPSVPLKSAHCITNENEIIRRAQQYITTHVRSRLTVPLVAQNTDVSTSYLTALFHKHLQISPGEYIRRIKLQESKQMIREGNMNFTEIAQALHYSTIHHFSRQFKEKFGITPSQYAKSIR